jgi:hypothetical protein
MRYGAREIIKAGGLLDRPVGVLYGGGTAQQHLGWTLLSQPTRPACARLLIKNPTPAV